MLQYKQIPIDGAIFQYGILGGPLPLVNSLALLQQNTFDQYH